MNIQQALEKLDLNDKQSGVYVALLQMGSGKIQDLVKHTGLKRTTIYSILDVLIHKGFVTMAKEGTHRKYYAEDPKRLPAVFDSELYRIKQQQKSLIEIIPELSTFFNNHATKPRIRFYEGMEGIKLVLGETLELSSGEEILAYSSAESIHKYFGDDYVMYYLAQRVQRGIVQRAVAEDSAAAREHRKNDVAELRQTRLVNKDIFPFSNEINIFRNKMCIISYKDLLGVIIESAEIAKTQRAIFELAWIGADKVER